MTTTTTTAPMTTAQRLALAADRHSLWAKDAARFEDVRAEFDLAAEECTEDVIEEAERINRAKLRELQSRLQGAVENAKTYQPATLTRRKPGKRATIFGYPATAVIRWMGKEGWDFEEAAIAIQSLTGKKVADATVRAALGHGRRGQRGEPAKLTAAQRRKVIAASK